MFLLAVGSIKRENIINVQSVFQMIKASPTPTIDSFTVLEEKVMTSADYIDKAVQDLADKLKIDEVDIKLQQVTETTWANSSLGCPKKGRLYAQIIIPGYIINLDAGGENYQYHAGSNRVITCVQ